VDDVFLNENICKYLGFVYGKEHIQTYYLIKILFISVLALIPLESDFLYRLRTQLVYKMTLG